MPQKLRAVFEKEKYDSVRTKLLAHRLDPHIRTLESKTGKNKGLIFPFARGLRFSALLIYIIRETLEGSGLSANWGQIIDEDGDYCSGECDIIIHTGKHEARWNGDGSGNHIMDFRFVNKNDVKVVISCKSYIKSSTVEIEYLNNLKSFVKDVWLFAECCGPKSIIPIKKKAKTIGYEQFWCLYTWNSKNGETNEQFGEWRDFMEKLRSLKN